MKHASRADFPPPRAPNESAVVIRGEWKPNIELARKVMAAALDIVDRVYGVELCRCGRRAPDSPDSPCGDCGELP